MHFKNAAAYVSFVALGVVIPCSPMNWPSRDFRFMYLNLKCAEHFNLLAVARGHAHIPLLQRYVLLCDFVIATMHVVSRWCCYTWC